MRELPCNWELKLTEHEAQLAPMPIITVGKNYGIWLVEYTDPRKP